MDMYVDEMLELYRVFPQHICNVDDMAAIADADRVLSGIEDEIPELLNDAGKYCDCLTGSDRGILRILVLGADGHYIAHALRNRYPNATVKWMPCPDHKDKSDIGMIDGIILSHMAADSFFCRGSRLAEWSGLLEDDGFVLFQKTVDIDVPSMLSGLNEADVVPFKYLKDNILYSVHKSGHMLKHLNMSESEKDHRLMARYRKVYCVCPPIIKTGGSEVLHQLVSVINGLGGDAEIVYVKTEEKGGYTDPQFGGYVAGHINIFENIEDDRQNAVVIPEGWAYVCADVNEADIFFWWLSVDNFRDFCNEDISEEELLTLVRYKTTVHMVQSEYAKNYILDNGISEERIVRLSDYINDMYLLDTDPVSIERKEDIVLYNPNKGKEFVSNLIEMAPEIRWTPIINMTTAQVRDIMKTAKVYIDFGHHPGKDRIPREAAVSGCIVITGRRGSAAFHEDVSIPDRYKQDENDTSYEDIIALICDCINRYSDLIGDFREYREKIKGEKKQFIEDVKAIFFDQCS